MSSLHQFTDTSAPNVKVERPVFHPNGGGSIIGHIGYDEDRDKRFAMLPRNRTTDHGEQHYFRKFSGYAISQTVLTTFKNRNVDNICIIERDGDERVLEYQIQQFNDGKFIAYDAELNTIIEGQAAFQARSSGEYDDPQRVLAASDATFTWEKSEVSLVR